MNIFSGTKKKKDPLYTPANMSVNQSVQKPSALNNPVSIWGNKISSGNGISATQNVFSSQLPKAPQVQSKEPQQNMSVAPKVIQGSGMTSAYASNPTNYSPRVTDEKRVDDQKQSAPNPLLTNIDNFLSGQSRVANQKMQLAKGQLEAGNELRSGMYNLQQDQLKGMKGDAVEMFNAYESGTLAGLDRVKAAGERNKANAEDYYGDAQRTAAQARRETQGDASRRFSALNTIDSFGEGSYKQATENIDSEFNRVTQQFAREKANTLAQIDDDIFAAEQTAQQAISSERVKLQQVLRQIDGSLQQGTMEYKFAQEQAYADYQETVGAIEEWYNGIQYTASQQKLTLQQELDSMSSFTPQFMATGVPTNQKEYEFLISNSDAFKELYPELFGGGGASAMDEKNQIVDLVDDVLASGTSNLTGNVRLGHLYAGGKDVKAKVEQIKNKLSVEERAKLKGQGTISDKEAEMLAKAVTSLDYGMTDEAFQQELLNIKAILGKQGATGTYYNNPSNSSINMEQFVSGK